MNAIDLLRLDINDLKKIDVKTVGQQLLARPDILISAGALLLSVIIAVSIVKNKRAQLNQIESEIFSLSDKQPAIDEYNAAKQQLDDLLTTFPPSWSDRALLAAVTQWAVQHHLEITSVLPTGKEERPDYTRSGFRIQVQAADFNDLLRFLRTIETDPHGVRIDELDIKGPSYVSDRSVGYSSGYQADLGETTPTITVNLLVSLINIHKDDNQAQP